MKLYCPHCGRVMEYPHDEKHYSLYDIFTGKRKKYGSEIRTKDIAYCIPCDFFLLKDPKEKDGWRWCNEIIKILHLIA